MDSEAYSKTIEKMMHSDNVSPIMKKVLEKEMNRAKSTASKSKSACTKEEMELRKEEESLISQANDAIQSVENGLRDDSYPAFLQPLMKKILEKMKSIRDGAVKDMKTRDGVEEVKQVNRTEGEKMKSKADPGEKSSDESVQSSEFMKSLNQRKASHSDILVQSLKRS